MPRRSDIDSVLVIGSGPIVIGQGCEFDYAGTQAIKALRHEGIRVVLVNSNPATIMTDPDLADATYIEPLTLDVLEQIIARERPHALLPTLGGQTALNLGLAASRSGLLRRHGCKLIGASEASIEMAEDRSLFKAAMTRIGLRCPTSEVVDSCIRAREVATQIGFPVISRPSFTLGGSGGGIVHDIAELERVVAFGLDQSPVHQVLVEEAVVGWKEFELEIVRDHHDNCVVVCTIENIDPMGVHTGDSVTVAPAMTLTDKEYQRMRDAAFAIMREVGVTTGGSNVQFAVHPHTGRLLVVEMNPRVSRSSALASKATGFPIAKIAAKLAIGYTLDELDNDITKVTPASFEPTLDYVVVKWPRFAFEKFSEASPTLGPQMKSVGEAMAIGRTFREAFGKAIRSLELGRAGFDLPFGTSDDLSSLERKIATPNPDRLFQLGRAFQLGLEIKRAHALTLIDSWFLEQIRHVALAELDLAARALGTLAAGPDLSGLEGGVSNLFGLPAIGELRAWKRLGLSDRRIAALAGVDESSLRAERHRRGSRPVYKRIDTCAAEFESHTSYLYSTYEDECEARPTDRDKVVILGGGPNRIGQGIEFDYCCVHAVMALREEGVESIMINCNPETVSTDYDTSDRLYFDPVTAEDVIEICHVERPRGVIIQLGGQTPLRLAMVLARAGIPILGTSVDAIDRAEDRERFADVVAKLGLLAPRWGIARNIAEARAVADTLGFPLMVRPSYVLGGRAMERIHSRASLDSYIRGLVTGTGTAGSDAARDAVIGWPVLIDEFLSDAIELDVDLVCDRTGATIIGGVMEHVEQAGIHSGDSACVLPPYSLPPAIIAEVNRQARALARELQVVGLMNVQFGVQADRIYVIEVNPRASRTIPFVSKATGQPLAKIATRVMLGRTLAELDVVEVEPSFVSVKEVVLPFIKFNGVDPVLGPEMRSTGEVMGIDRDFARAFAKSQLAAGNELPVRGRALLAMQPDDLDHALHIGQGLRAQGFEIIATPITGDWLREHGVAAVDIAVDDAVAALAERAVQLVVVTAAAQAIAETRPLRQGAVRHGVPLFTTSRSARAAIEGIRALRERPLGVEALQARHSVSVHPLGGRS